MAKLAYGIEDRPGRVWESLLYGWQHTLVDISPFVLPLAIGAALDWPALQRAELINFCLLSMGVATLLQTTLGNRLPIIQGPSATLTGALVPVGTQLGAAARWGGAWVGALVETIVGGARVPGRLQRWFPTAVSGAVVMSIGLSLGRLAVRLSLGDGSTRNLLFAGGVIACVLLLQGLGRTWLGGLVARAAIFLTIWLVGVGIGGFTGDVDWQLVAARPWLQLPRLFPWGGPGLGWQFSVAATLAVLAGYFGSMVESVGDYVATCSVTDTELQPRHVNRGILAEGLGCIAALCLGGLPCTSYTQNIGIIAATGVASRFVVRLAAVVLMLYGLCPKFGALLVAMPRAVLGGVFVLVCAMIVASGVGLVRKSASTSANHLVVGLTLVLSVGVPVYVASGIGAERLAAVPEIVRLLATNSVVLAVVFAVGLNAAINRGHPAATR